MADDGIGGRSDRARLFIDGEEVLVAEDYTIAASVLTQPAAFTIRMGWGDTAAELARRYDPGTPFHLLINDVVYQVGYTDGFSGGGAATSVSFPGRDILQKIHDAFITTEVSFKDATYADLVGKAMAAVELNAELVFTNRENRKRMTGVPVQETKEPRSVGGDKIGSLVGGQARAAQAKIGDRWYQLIKRHLDRAGLFLWAGNKGELILSEPNSNQAPTYRIIRQRGGARPVVTILDDQHQNITTGRFSECVVYARGGGRRFGRTSSKGAFVDDEMFNWGFKRPLVIRDVNATSVEQAEFIARRKLAETRRNGWKLSYTVSGHTVPSLRGGLAVWAPDTVVEVIDDKWGLNGKYWIEGVTFERKPECLTRLELMRPTDLIFGSDDD